MSKEGQRQMPTWQTATRATVPQDKKLACAVAQDDRVAQIYGDPSLTWIRAWTRIRIHNNAG
jgi:hypothetical protein